MKSYRTNTGPFDERPFFSSTEIDRMCVEELRNQGLYPSEPSPIRIDRFVEKRFGVQPAYEELPAGLLGFTAFGAKGVQGIFVSKPLDDEGTTVAERRLRTTLAHEAGHGLLHAHLFALAGDAKRLFGSGVSDDGTKILCRGEAPDAGLRTGRSSPWWEYQANLMMGALLLPRPLVNEALASLHVAHGERRILPRARRDGAIRRLSEVFDVNPIVAHIRLKSLSILSDAPTASGAWPFVRRVRLGRRPSLPK